MCSGVGLSRFLESSSPDRMEVLAAVKSEWKAHPVSLEAFLTVIGSLDCDDAPTIIRSIVDDATPDSIFNVNLAGHARAVARYMLWTC